MASRISNKSNNLGSLGKQLKAEVDIILIGHNETIKSIAKKVMWDVTQRTVVDTTQAMSNWIATLDKPHEGEIEANVYGRKGQTAEQSQNVAISKAAVVIDNKKLGQSIFITNDLSDNIHAKNAELLEAQSLAMDDAITAVAKADITVRQL